MDGHLRRRPKEGKHRNNAPLEVPVVDLLSTTCQAFAAQQEIRRQHACLPLLLEALRVADRTASAPAPTTDAPSTPRHTSPC